MSNVVVFGSTSFTGQRIAKELAQRGHEVTAVSRSGGEGSIQADVTDPGAVKPLVQSADVIVISTRAYHEGQNLLKQAVQAVLDAGSSARLAVVGGSGSLSNEDGGPRRLDLPGFPDIYRGEAAAHADTLDYLRDQDPSVSWFYLSPTGNFNFGPEPENRGTYRTQLDVVVFDADGESHISGDDYALAFVDEIESSRHRNRRFTVGY